LNLRPRHRDDPEINLISMIDVLLVLLIFFMVSTTFLQEGGVRIHLPQGYGEVGAGTYDARDDQVAIEVMAYAPIAAGVEDATDRLIDGFRLGCRNTRPGHPGEFASSKEVSDTGITARCVCRMGDGSVSLLKALVWTHDGRSYAKSVRVESFPMPGKTPALAPLLERASAILDEVSYSSH